MAHVRQFGTGANRDVDEGKPDFEGYLSPWVIARYGQYMLAHQQTPEGTRASDNWQQGIPQDQYMKSAWRHFLAWWTAHREGRVDEEAICGVLFNASGFLHEGLKRDQHQA